MLAIFADFRKYPPLEMTAAAMAGYKPKGADSGDSVRVSLDQFRRMWESGSFPEQ